MQTIEHILRICPRYDTARRKQLTANDSLQNIPQVVLIQSAYIRR